MNEQKPGACAVSDPAIVALVERLRTWADNEGSKVGPVYGPSNPYLIALLRGAADALSVAVPRCADPECWNDVAAPLSADLPEALCRALHAKGWNVVDCETVERLARDISAVAAPPDEVARLRRLAKEATNGWACVAKRNAEHDEIARLHREIDRAPEPAVAAPPEGTLTREQAETRLTDEVLNCVGDVYVEPLRLMANRRKAARGILLAALFPHDGSRT